MLEEGTKWLRELDMLAWIWDQDNLEGFLDQSHALERVASVSSKSSGMAVPVGQANDR